MTRFFFALALALAAGAATGCHGSGEARAQDSRIREIQRDEAIAREAARSLAPIFSDEAGALSDAAKARQDPAADAAKKRIEDAQAALDALEDAEQTFQVGRRYYEIWETIKLSAADRGRVDTSVARMVEQSRLLLGHALWLVKAARQRDEAEAERARKAIERDRLVLKAYRNDLGITARLGPEVAEPHGGGEPAAAQGDGKPAAAH